MPFCLRCLALLLISLSACQIGPSTEDIPNALAKNPWQAVVFATYEVTGYLGMTSGDGAMQFVTQSRPFDPSSVDPQTAAMLQKAYASLPQQSIAGQQGFLVRDTLSIPSSGFGYAPAGRYALNAASVAALNTYYDFGGWKRPERMAYMVFSIAPGEAVYLGHIKFREENDLVTFNVEDRFEAFKATLPPPLQQKIVKRIVAAPSSLKPLHKGTVMHTQVIPIITYK